MTRNIEDHGGPTCIRAEDIFPATAEEMDRLAALLDGPIDRADLGRVWREYKQGDWVSLETFVAELLEDEADRRAASLALAEAAAKGTRPAEEVFRELGL